MCDQVVMCVCVCVKVYWFKDGKQISKMSEHYRISREADGTCSLHTASASLDDDGNYTIMAGNPLVRHTHTLYIEYTHTHTLYIEYTHTHTHCT